VIGADQYGVLQQRGGRNRLSLPQQQSSKVVERFGVGGIERHRPLKPDDRPFVFTLHLEQAAKQVVRLGVERAVLKCEFHLDVGFLQVASHQGGSSCLVVLVGGLNLGGCRLGARGVGQRAASSTQKDRHDARHNPRDVSVYTCHGYCSNYALVFVPGIAASPESPAGNGLRTAPAHPPRQQARAVANAGSARVDIRVSTYRCGPIICHPRRIAACPCGPG